jgi:hypothetical protein
VLAGATPIPAAALSATQFLVTAPQPQIDSVSPLFLQVGQPLAPLTIGGRNFQNTQAVRVLPPDGVTVGTPSVDGTATTIVVNISATASAALGPRVVVVDTAAGSTSAVATVNNTITLTNTAGTIFTPIMAPELGVVLEAPAAPVTTLIEPIFSGGVGVLLQEAPAPPATQSLAVTGIQLGVALGPVATGVQPAGVLAGTSGTLVVDGRSLGGVIAVALVPADGITFGAPVVDGTGTQLSVPITVAAGAVEGWRAVVLSTATGSVPFADPARTQFYIGTATPALSSISPIVAAQGTGITLTVRGQGFRTATEVTASPSDGITIGAPSVNALGTELTVPVSIAPNASLGAHVIRVSTPVGTSSAEAAPANTLTVIAP